MTDIERGTGMHFRWWVRRNGWWLFLVGIALGISMAIWGFWIAQDYYFDANNKLRWGDIAYYILQMIPLYGFGPVNPEMPWQLNFARFWLPLVFFSTAAMGIVRLIGRRSLGLSRFFLNGHVIVCGDGEQAMTLVRQYRLKALPPQVLLVASGDGFASYGEMKGLGVEILIDDPATAECWRNANISRAKAVYLVADEDLANLRGFEALSSEVSRAFPEGHASLLPCFVHLGDIGLRRWLIDALQSPGREQPKGLRWYFFSTWENCARYLFVSHGPHTQFVQGESSEPPSMLILGSNAIAEQIVLQAAKLGHYATTGKLRVDLVAADSTRIERSLMSRYPALDPDFCERWSSEERALVPLIDLHCHDLSPDCPPATLFESLNGMKRPFQVCFVCIDDAALAISAVEALRAQGCNAHFRKPPFSIVLCLPGEAGAFERVVRNRRWFGVRKLESDNLTVFDPLVHGFKMEEGEALIGQKSEIDAMRIYQFYMGRQDVDWEALSESEKDSNRQAADHLRIKRCFLDRDDEHLMRMEHERWCAERLLAGWRHSPQKQVAERLNPNLCPYDDLPLVEREKNRPTAIYARGVEEI